MPPTVRMGILCDYALTSQEGKLSVLGIFGSMNFQTLPAAFARFFAVIVLSLDATTHEVRFGIADPVGQQILPDAPSMPVEVDAPGVDTNLIIGFDNVMFQRAGIHQVQLFVDGRLTHSIPLAVQAMGSSGFPPVQAN